MSKTNKYPRGGFTLIELLVVVLIIGILAAIALPQYQRAVAKSKAAQLQTMISPIVSAVERYYLVNNEYPTSWDVLDIDIEWPTASSSVCSVSVPNSRAVKRGNGSEIILNMDSPTGNFIAILAVIAEGPYKCTGYVHFFKAIGFPTNTLLCEEAQSPERRGSKNQRGDFCEKVMGATYVSDLYSWYQFI